MRFPTATLGISSIAFILGLYGCQSRSSPASSGRAVATAPAGSPTTVNEPRRFGSPITAGDPVSLASVMAKPDDFENRSVVVEAKVRRNCTRRGCWMELSDELGTDSPGCRVTFKDYGFFVPLDSAGSNARVQGTVQVRVVPDPEVAHLESEGAKFASKQPDGSAREVRMVATGVELWRGPS